MSRKKKFALALVALLVLIQLVPVDTENPEVTAEVDAPTEVLEILRRACYDCHSNETVWPWYTHLAPVNFLVAHDVEEGREHLNFSEWDRYDPERRAHKISEVWEEVEEGEMPLWFYTPLHPEAELSAADLAALEAWARTEGEGTD
ncbi:MAG: heme-binding domain-containing protein [Planctomycetota bacterium]|nr:heme-binding domain-containing protein [Planctomycetota bacterium]